MSWMYNNCGEAQHERMKEREGRKGEGERERDGSEGVVSIFSSDKIPKTSSSEVIKLDSKQKGRTSVRPFAIRLHSERVDNGFCMESVQQAQAGDPKK